MNKLFGYSWVGWLNIVFLQWFFIRLFYSVSYQDNVGSYGLIFPIVPLTGWWGDYIPGKYWNIKL